MMEFSSEKSGYHFNSNFCKHIDKFEATSSSQLSIQCWCISCAVSRPEFDCCLTFFWLGFTESGKSRIVFHFAKTFRFCWQNYKCSMIYILPSLRLWYLRNWLIHQCLRSNWYPSLDLDCFVYSFFPMPFAWSSFCPNISEIISYWLVWAYRREFLCGKWIYSKYLSIFFNVNAYYLRNESQLDEIRFL